MAPTHLFRSTTRTFIGAAAFSLVLSILGASSLATAAGDAAFQSAFQEFSSASAGEKSAVDKAADAWTRRPWSQVHARAEGIATRILDQPQSSAVGLVGEPTADFVAAIHATWLAGRSLSILPGPVRGADPQQWAQATLTRFTGLGVRTVFSHGDELAFLSGHDAAPTVLDLATVAQHHADVVLGSAPWIGAGDR